MKSSNRNKYYLGIDCGSVSLKVAILDEKMNIIWTSYRRTHGLPLKSMSESISDMFTATNIDVFEAIVTTGSARNILADLFNIKAINEIMTHGLAGGFFYPKAKSIIEIGGQDSKLIFLEENISGEVVIADSVMNDICAAGTGSFLDQQAFRMGISIEELSNLATQSNNPAKIAGRCSVFTKTDMIHLQQGGVSKEDLAAGLCEAVVRTYMESLIKGKSIESPILFQGGVANNAGMRQAFRKLLKKNEDEIIIPKNFGVMGAVGSCLYAIKHKFSYPKTKIEIFDSMTKGRDLTYKRSHLPKLSSKNFRYSKYIDDRPIIKDGDVYLGVDVGSVTVKLVVINSQKQMTYKKYVPINGEPIDSVKLCLNDLKDNYKNVNFKIKGVGVTGSGRHFIANAIGADTVKNEITAQAHAAISLVPDVDTIFEIGGQDSKYIRVENGTVVDFIMNKTCAAGTGSFLAEQAGRLKIDLKDEFSNMAMKSNSPVDMGSRCTVFMETDSIHYQQNNVPKTDILAGLSYSIAKNFLEKVVGNLKIGRKIVFQGGVAYNRSVTAAFGSLLNVEITVVPHHEVTGALGIALIAFDESRNREDSTFVGFDLTDRIQERKTTECKGCSNLCSLINVKYNDGKKSIYGSNCGKFESDNFEVNSNKQFPNYFHQRDILLNSYKNRRIAEKGVIGIPTFLLFFELFPMWATFFNELGYNVATSKMNSKQSFKDGISNILADTCFPIKAVYGSISEMKNRGIEKIFVPYVINMRDDTYKTTFAHNCQYVQIVPDLIKASMNVELISPVIRMKDSHVAAEEPFIKVGRQLGADEKDIKIAFQKACRAQKRFVNQLLNMGKKSLAQLPENENIFVLIGHPYVIHDKYFNMNIVNRLLKLGIPVIPGDILPLGDAYDKACNLDLVWKTNNRAINIANYIHNHNETNSTKLLPIVMTTFGCAPDSMLTPYLSDIFKKQPWLEIELDEHNSITGILTRCEAFWESIKGGNPNSSYRSFENLEKFTTSNVSITDIKREDRTLYIHEFSEAFVSIVDVFRKHGVKCELIPETSFASNMLGRKLSNEKHCRTYQVLLGDYMATTMLDSYDHEKSVFMTFGYDEACRLALFKDLHEIILKEKTGSDVWLFGPTPDDPVDWIKKFGLELAVDMWEAMVAHDYISRYKFEVRPYEKIKGSTDKAYHQAVGILTDGIYGNTIINSFKRAMDIVKRVKIDNNRDLIKIGIVGDAFTRVHKYGMNAIFQGIEENGGVVIVPPSWHDFVIYGAEVRTQTLKKRKLFKQYELVKQGYLALSASKDRIEKIAGNYSAMFPDPNNKWLRENAERYINIDIAPVIPSMFIGKTIDFVEQKDIDGILNAHGFNCILGKISTACYNPIRIANGGIPMLTFIDDGLQQTNISTRIEAFMDQARTFKHKKNWENKKAV